MNLQSLSSEILNQSRTIEEIFISFSTEFPLLLDKSHASSLDELLSTLYDLDEENKLSSKTESSHFSNYEEKYSKLFIDLNKKIDDLRSINGHISQIKNDSEEMELIALNAMVVSIKSGEKGRAFSSITENLQQLSSNMIALSSKLAGEEEFLINSVNSLKDLFHEITGHQKEISNISTREIARISDCITQSATPLEEIKQLSQKVYPAIQSAMECLQLQDIIKQAFEHVLTCFREFAEISLDQPVEERLDIIAFNISLAEIAKKVLQDIGVYLQRAIDTFSSKWQAVDSILSQTDEKRSVYLHNFSETAIEGENRNSIVENLKAANDGFQEQLKIFSQFQSAQKKVISICHSIIDKAHGMYDVFANLRPVISRLQHVRILQQIEVSKNDAIITVKDFVTDMDNLIMDSSDSLDAMQTTIETFIAEIGDMISMFTTTMTTDNEKMAEVRTEKLNFFTNMQTTQAKIYSLLKNFTVYPPEFSMQCDHVNTLFTQLKLIETDFLRLQKLLSQEIINLTNKKIMYMHDLNLDTYEIVDTKFKKLIEKFTITAHKEAVGKIGGFAVETGSAPGDITFF
ncbi:MAG: hypothetical protein SPE30_10900 [Candidatus Treponema excrementipullorum]|nr:hypothetical protein [Candidatus Treponema excrementipullorum]